MKKQSSKLVLIAMLFAIFLTSNKSKAQTPNCPYYVNNLTLCNIQVTYETFDNGVSCGVSGVQTIASAGNLAIPCSAWCGTTPTDVIITLISVGGNAVAGAPAVSVFNTIQGYTCTGCCTQPANPQMLWTAPNTQIYY